ncbi:MAG: hypothetical protein QOH26_956 [Actinomycetota bacterium]|nr:hypothetical protein [Actinomycetota bacterium]
MTVPRRLLLLAGFLGVLVAALWLWLPDQEDPIPAGIRRADFEVDSHFVDGPRDAIGLVPVSMVARPPLLVLLHGRGGEPKDLLSAELFKALLDRGADAPIVVLLDGGEASYWHDRADGAWGRYVVNEAIPAAAEELGADGDRVAIGGISMGGFGALDLARLFPSRFCAVGGHSAALWRTGGETPNGAFDDAEDFARHDLFAAAEAGPVYEMPVWIDVGDDDPFVEADKAFAGLLEEQGADVTLHTAPGEHSYSYWNPHMDEYIDFYSDALAACGG